MQKRAISMILTLAMLCAFFPKLCLSAASAETTDSAARESFALDYGKIPGEFSNEGSIALNPELSSNMFFIPGSSGYSSNSEILQLSNGILRLAVYWNKHLYINDYSADHELLESRDIPLNVSKWGGMCLGEDTTFVFFSQRSEDDTILYKIAKYDADFNETATIVLNDYTDQTLNLMVFSNVAMGLRDHTLTIFTDRDFGGTFFNCNVFAIDVDVQKMGTSDPDAVSFLLPGNIGINGDPYRNLLGFDENKPVFAAVIGSDYPGGIYVGQRNAISHLKPDTDLGDNENNEDLILTDATNLAVSSSHYLVASVFENYGVNNIYLAAREKESGKKSGYLLTNATAFNSEINGNPWIVDLGNDRFALLWERLGIGTMDVCSVQLDASGTPIGKTQLWRGCSLSTMVPICADGKILWITAGDGKMELHQLSDLDASGYQELADGIVKADRVWNGTADSSWYREDKTDFSISNAEQLAGLAELVNEGNDFEGKTIRLQNDLFMNSTPFGHVENNRWIPIGASEDGTAVFNGTFDGQCHTIYNMVVPAEGLAGGVFGTIGTTGTVKCLTMEQGWFGSSACVADTNYGNVLFCMAKSYVDSLADDPRGGICRSNYGLIYGCQNFGFIEHSNQCGGIVYVNEQGGTISQCANKGMLYTYLNTFTQTGTSGIAYNSYGWIYNCYNLGAAQNGSDRSAGIVGYSNGGLGCGQVYNCYSLSGYPLEYPICVSTGYQGKVKNCFGNTEPGMEWYKEFCAPEFLTKLDEQLGPMATAWLPDTLGINHGLPVPVAEYNYHIGNYKVQPELWGVAPAVTVSLSERDTISLSGVEYYYTDAMLEITSDNTAVAEVVGGEIRLHQSGTARILFHFDETEESTALDYTMVITVKGHSYEAEVTESTCQTQGYTTYTCSECGYSYVDDYTDPVDHSYEDGYCKWCGIGEQSVVWSSISTSLGGNIAMNFYVELSEDLVADPDAYMQFTFASKTVKVPLSEGVLTNGTYRFSCPITSKNMTDDITAQVYNASGAVGASKTMSVDTYCNWVIENFKDEKTVNLMKAMLNYGASAQMLFSYRTDDLANAALADSDKILGKVDASAFAHSRVGEADGIKPVSYTLLLDSETTVRCYFQLTGTKTIDEFTFMVDGEEVTPTYKDGYYYIEKANIAAHRLDDMHTFTCGSITITYGGLSYVNQVMTYYTSGTTFDMASALYAYSKAAEAYIG